MEVIDCKYSVYDIDKITGYTTWSDKKKIDTLLHIDSIMYSNLGSESIAKERSHVKTLSKKIYKTIKSIDNRIGTMLLQEIDA
jgi:hypothetical protein